MRYHDMIIYIYIFLFFLGGWSLQFKGTAGDTEGLCVLESPGATQPDHCALVCTPGVDVCPTGATCKTISNNQGVCTYNN